MSIGKLGQLIASLSKNEKAYFKRWLPNTKKENRYVLVFDKVDKHPDISIKNLIEKLGPDYTSKQLKNIYSHLWNSLLLSLRDYHRNNDIQLDFHARLDSIKVLRTKGQLTEALKASRKLLTDCEEIEMFPEALRAIEHIENIRSLQNTLEKADPNEWKNLYAKKEQICLSLAESCRVRGLERELKFLNDNLGGTLNKNEHKTRLDQLQYRLDQISFSEESSFDAQFRYFSVRATISSVLGDKDKIEFWFGNMVELLDQNPVITERYYKGFYIVVMHNYIHTLLTLKKLDSIPELLHRMKLRQGELPELATRDFYAYGICVLTYYNLKEDYQLGVEEWLRLSKNIPNSSDPSVEYDRIKFILQGALVYFWKEDYKHSLSVLRPLLNQVPFSAENKDLVAAKALEILCNYELSDYDHTEHLIHSFQRKLKESNAASDTELRLVNTVHNQLKRRQDPTFTWTKLVEFCNAKAADFDFTMISFDMSRYAKRKSSTE